MGESWWQHFRFAIGIACKLMIASVFWMAHALLPFVPLPVKLNLDSLVIKLGQESFYRKQKKKSMP